MPLAEVLRHHRGGLVLGALAIVACYAVFYISTVFALDYGVRVAHIPRSLFLQLMCLAAVAMAATTLLSAALAQRCGCRRVLLAGLPLTALSGFALAPLLGAGDAAHALLFLLLALGLMGLIFAPLGALLPALFPAPVRYTGASAAYNLGGILGASLAPFAAQLLLARGGLPWVGLYITAAAAISFVAVLLLRERYS
jgi:MFS family permease